MLEINSNGGQLETDKDRLQTRIEERNRGRQVCPDIDRRRVELTATGEAAGSRGQEEQGGRGYWN
jgi:hypothetical protein